MNRLWVIGDSKKVLFPGKLIFLLSYFCTLFSEKRGFLLLTTFFESLIPHKRFKSYISYGKRQKSCTLIVILVKCLYLTSPIFNPQRNRTFYAGEKVLNIKAGKKIKNTLKKISVAFLEDAATQAVVNKLNISSCMWRLFGRNKGWNSIFKLFLCKFPQEKKIGSEKVQFVLLFFRKIATEDWRKQTANLINSKAILEAIWKSNQAMLLFGWMINISRQFYWGGGLVSFLALDLQQPHVVNRHVSKK